MPGFMSVRPGPPPPPAGAVAKIHEEFASHPRGSTQSVTPVLIVIQVVLGGVLGGLWWLFASTGAGQYWPEPYSVWVSPENPGIEAQRDALFALLGLCGGLFSGFIMWKQLRKSHPMAHLLLGVVVTLVATAAMVGTGIACESWIDGHAVPLTLRSAAPLFVWPAVALVFASISLLRSILASSPPEAGLRS